MGNMTAANLALEKFRLEVQISEMELSMKRFDLRLLTMEEEKRQIAENKVASLKHIDELKQQVADLNKSIGG
jgi:hypothetical protein